MEAFLVIIGVLIGAGIVYVNLSPKVKATQQLDQDTAYTNEKLRINSIQLEKEISSLTARKEEIILNIGTLQKQAEESANSLYEKSYELANEKMNQAAEKMSQNYRRLEAQAKKEYEETLKDCSSSLLEQLDIKNKELEKINSQIADLTSKMNSAIEANKRAEIQRNEKDFYRLCLTDVDINEIKHLRSVGVYLRDSEPLNKVIWKVYYEKPYTDLIGRVVGTGVHCGIYKITNIENQMCYVGQAANIADRWKQHIKRGIGAETPTRNKLYPAMLEKGVENFTFEIIEEVERNKLNEREDYWQEYFKAKEFGYSIK